MVQEMTSAGSDDSFVDLSASPASPVAPVPLTAPVGPTSTAPTQGGPGDTDERADVGRRGRRGARHRARANGVKRRPLRGNPAGLAIVGGEAVSVFGDQLARIAIAILVFGRTHSAVLSAATLAVSYLPWILAAPLLSGLGDRYPKRRVLVACDALRALCAVALAIPGQPTALLLALLFVLNCGEPPFAAARSALMPDVFGDSYVEGQAAFSSVSVAMTFAGLAVGGGVVALLGASGALTVDAVTFAVSSLALRLYLPSTPALPQTSESRPGRGWALVMGNPAARWALAVGASLIAVDTVGLGLAAPWAAQLRGGPLLVGGLAAASLLGTVVGNAVLTRIPAEQRDRLLLPAALGVVVTLVPFLVVRNLAATLCLLFVSGACTTLQVVVNQRFVLAMPAEARSRAFGVAGTAINVGQGVAVLAAGALADTLEPSTVVGFAGVLGVGIVVLLAATQPPRGAAVPPKE